MWIRVALVLLLVATGPCSVVGQQPEDATARPESPPPENRRALLVFVGDPQWSPSSEPFVELDRRAPDALRDVLAARFDLRLVRLPLRLADASDDVRALARRYAIRTVPTLTFTDDEERPLVELGPEDVARPLGLVDLVPLLARRAEQRRRVLEAAMSVRDSARVRRLDGFLRELDPDLAQRFFGRQIDALLSARTDDQRLHDRQRVWRLSRDAFVRGQRGGRSRNTSQGQRPARATLGVCADGLISSCNCSDRAVRYARRCCCSVLAWRSDRVAAATRWLPFATSAPWRRSVMARRPWRTWLLPWRPEPLDEGAAVASVHRPRAVNMGISSPRVPVSPEPPFARNTACVCQGDSVQVPVVGER